MADAWSTVVEREPEWDERARGEALALIADERTTCHACGLVMADITSELRTEARNVAWGDGRKFEVRVYRCLGCMARTLVERDFTKQHEDHKPQPRVYSPTDGVRFRVQQISQKESDGHS